jgi:hypothetical protein
MNPLMIRLRNFFYPKKEILDVPDQTSEERQRIRETLQRIQDELAVVSRERYNNHGGSE